MAISITAVDPPSSSPYSASTGSPSGPRTRSVRRSPGVAATSASTVPSPPSAIGTSTRSASGAAARTPSAIASAASSADNEPLKALGAMTMRISPSPARWRRRSVDGCEPGPVFAIPAAHDLEIQFLQPLDDRPDLAIADEPAVDVDHRRNLGAGAAEEDLVGNVELGAVDRALEDFHAELGTEQLDHGEPGEALENIVGRRRREHLAVANHEDILGAALADMALMRQHDGLVEAVFLGLRFGKCGVDINAGDLCPGRRRIVVDPSPARDHAVDASLDVDVVAEGRHVDGKRIFEIVKPDADLFGALEGKGSDVYVLAEVVAPDQFNRCGGKLIQGDRDLEFQDLDGILHSAIVLAQLEEEKLLVFWAPIAADALEDPGAVVQGVRHQTQAGVAIPL